MFFLRIEQMQKIWMTVCVVLIATYGLVNGQTLGGLSDSAQSKQPPQHDKQDAPGVRDMLGEAIHILIEKARDQMGGKEATGNPWTSNESPRDTIFTFIQNMHMQHYAGQDRLSVIAKTLPTGYTAHSLEVIALQSVFQRLGALHPSDFPSGSSSLTAQIQEFEVFPYAIDHTWVWEWLDEAPEGRIVVQKQNNGNWQFSLKTVQGAPALLKSLRAIPPKYSNENLQQERKLFLPSFDSTTWWAWLIAATGLVGAFYIGRKSRSWLIRFGDRFEARTKPIIGSFFRSISTSISIILGTLIFIIACHYIELSPALSNLYWKFIQLVLLIAVVWVFFGITDLISTLVRYHVVHDNDEYSTMTVTIIQRVIHTFLFIIIAVYFLENVFSFNIGALITGLGVLGLAISLAGKETAQNLFGAVSIFINRPFVVGDWVQFKGQIGEVSDVRMQATQIRLLSGEMLIVPNMQFISNEVENLAMRKYMRREMNIAIPYATDAKKVDHAMQRIDEVLRSDAIVNEGKCNLDERPPIISFSEFGDYYLNLKVYYWYFIGDEGEALQRNSERGWFSYLEHCTLVNRAILKAFKNEDIQFAFPTQTIALGKANEGTT